MKPVVVEGGNIRAVCHNCGTTAIFERTRSGKVFGHYLTNDAATRYDNRLLICSGCGFAAIAKMHVDRENSIGVLNWFYPRGMNRADLPEAVPTSIVNEFREAEDCAKQGLNRAASAMVRSTLEKTLKANGYKGGIAAIITAAGKDSVITKARARRAHEDIRLLGNEVVHDEWRQVDDDEISKALRYAQRILEDLYDDREEAEGLLKELGRLPPAEAE